jgi:hypothetical protein
MQLYSVSVRELRIVKRCEVNAMPRRAGGIPPDDSFP